jgi:hypothetical protein
MNTEANQQGICCWNANSVMVANLFASKQVLIRSSLRKTTMQCWQPATSQLTIVPKQNVLDKPTDTNRVTQGQNGTSQQQQMFALQWNQQHKHKQTRRCTPYDILQYQYNLN